MAFLSHNTSNTHSYSKTAFYRCIYFKSFTKRLWFKFWLDTSTAAFCNFWNRGHVIKQRHVCMGVCVCVCVCESCRLMNVCLTHSTAAVSRANVMLTHSLPTALCLAVLFYESILFLPGLTAGVQTRQEWKRWQTKLHPPPQHHPPS